MALQRKAPTLVLQLILVMRTPQLHLLLTQDKKWKRILLRIRYSPKKKLENKKCVRKLIKEREARKIWNCSKISMISFKTKVLLNRPLNQLQSLHFQQLSQMKIGHLIKREIVKNYIIQIRANMIETPTLWVNSIKTGKITTIRENITLALQMLLDFKLITLCLMAGPELLQLISQSTWMVLISNQHRQLLLVKAVFLWLI